MSRDRQECLCHQRQSRCAANMNRSFRAMQMRMRHRLLLIAVCAFASASARADLSDVLGVTHIDGQYYFTGQDYLDEGANQVIATGSHVIKLELGRSTLSSKYEWNSTWPALTS